MKKFTADFETATWKDDETWVWAWATCNIETEEMQFGNNIDSFIDYCYKEKNSVFYFHNLKFDGEFIIYWALTHEFTHVTEKEDIADNTFTTLISNMGQFYQICLYFKKGNKTVHKVTFYDSLKIIPFSVDETAKYFNLSISKLTLDYNTPREIGHILTAEENEYIKNDVLIMKQALQVTFDKGLTKMTRASNALTDYKEIVGKSRFNHLFPVLDKTVDADLRKSYKRSDLLILTLYIKKKMLKQVWC